MSWLSLRAPCHRGGAGSGPGRHLGDCRPRRRPGPSELLTRAIGSGEMTGVALGRAYYNRGVVLQAMGMAGQAYGDYTKGIGLAANRAAAYTNRGNILARNGQLGAALEDYHEAVRADPLFVPAYTQPRQDLRRIGTDRPRHRGFHRGAGPRSG